jgi:hypothetical protein
LFIDFPIRNGAANSETEVKRLKQLMANRLSDIIELKVNNAMLVRQLKEINAQRKCCERERLENGKLTKKVRKLEKMVQ